MDEEMNVLNKYNIAFKGLGEGNHAYDFEIGDAFFEAAGSPDVKGGKLGAHVDLHKTSSSMTLDCRITGNVTVECDRCLEDCVVPVDYDGRLTVKFTAEALEPGEEYDGDILWLPQEASELNIAQYLYESIVLSLPYQRVHAEDENGMPGCNPGMLSRFEIISGEEFDSRFADSDTYLMEESPVGDKLRELKDKLENK